MLAQLSDGAALTTTEMRLLEAQITQLDGTVGTLSTTFAAADDVINPSGGFFGGIKSSLDNLLSGMTGGTGTISGFFGQLGGGIVEGFGNILSGGITGLISTGIGAIGGFFKNLFGGPSEAELQAREIVRVWEDTIIAGLSETQAAEAGAERWAQVVVGVRDAFIEVGRSEQQALDIVQALWDAIKEGPEAVSTVIQAIQPILAEAEALRQQSETTVTSSMETLREQAGNAAQSAAEAMAGLNQAVDQATRPRLLEIEIRQTGTLPGVPSTSPPLIPPAAEFQHGTGGHFVDFGRGTPVILHGRERVVTEREGRQAATDLAGVEARLSAIEALLSQQPRQLAKAFSDAVAMHA